MLQLSFIRSNKEKVIAGLQKKHFQDVQLVDALIGLDDQRKKLQSQSDDLLAKRNTASKSIGALLAQGKKDEAEESKSVVASLKEKIDALVTELANVEETLTQQLLKLPNLPNEIVPVGKAAEDNEVITQSPSLPTLYEGAKAHWDLITEYDLVDFQTGVKITGSGFPLYKGKGAKLQRALIQYFLDYNTNAGYTEYIPPHVVNSSSAYGTGQLPDKEGQMYFIQEDELYLIPTAEVPVTNIYRDEIVSAASLPIKMTAYTPCFRREAGSFGKDVRGLNRVHQFDKVEIVQLTDASKSYAALDEMVAHVEKLIQSLELPYRILRLCGGDMSFASALTYDFEVFSAAQQRWLEVSSVSNFETFQTNRLKIRTKDEQGKTQLLHSLNGSSLALPRILASMLENFQTPDGIIIPKVLQPYFGASMIH
ncbi:MAG: serine--tRNA ligase [Chitinophagia bacterium]|jgi:seryl-tRNA synthetase|nr:serine--tRNA ligase [Chitinophagia bacterium]